MNTNGQANKPRYSHFRIFFICFLESIIYLLIFMRSKKCRKPSRKAETWRRISGSIEKICQKEGDMSTGYRQPCQAGGLALLRTDIYYHLTFKTFFLRFLIVLNKLYSTM